MAALGFRVLRFWNGEVDGDLGAVLDTIVATLSPAGDPAPVRAARDSAFP